MFQSFMRTSALLVVIAFVPSCHRPPDIAPADMEARIEAAEQRIKMNPGESESPSVSSPRW